MTFIRILIIISLTTTTSIAKPYYKQADVPGSAAQYSFQAHGYYDGAGRIFTNPAIPLSEHYNFSLDYLSNKRLHNMVTARSIAITGVWGIHFGVGYQEELVSDIQHTQLLHNYPIVDYYYKFKKAKLFVISVQNYSKTSQLV